MCTILSRRVLMIVLYIQPNTPSELLFENLDKLLSSVPSDSVPTFVCGDFNINHRSGDSSVRILSELAAYHGFIQYVKQPTHRKGGTLDHIYVNHFFDDSEHLLVIPVHYSDHFHVHLALLLVNVV